MTNSDNYEASPADNPNILKREDYNEVNQIKSFNPSRSSLSYTILAVGFIIFLTGVTLIVGINTYNYVSPTITYCHSHQEDEPPYDCDYIHGEWRPRNP